MCLQHLYCACAAYHLKVDRSWIAMDDHVCAVARLRRDLYMVWKEADTICHPPTLVKIGSSWMEQPLGHLAAYLCLCPVYLLLLFPLPCLCVPKLLIALSENSVARLQSFDCMFKLACKWSSSILLAVQVRGVICPMQCCHRVLA